MRRLSFGLIVLLCAAGPTWAQSAGPAENAESVRALLERIERLEKRLAELEARQPAGPNGSTAVAASTAAEPAAPNAPAEKREPAGMSHAGMGQGAMPPQEAATYPALKISGFADVNFSATDETGTTSGFNMGQFVLHMASPLSKKVSYFGELSFTATATGYNLEVERSIIRYDYNDFFKLSFGRYHTPVNYWNTAFHHGSWLQTTISRPEMIRFGGRFLPVHFVGLLAEGDIPSGAAGLGYNAGVGNGRGSVFSRAGDAGDVNNNRAWTVNLFSRPSRAYGLQIGGGVYHDKLSPGPGQRFREWISSAHLVWTRETPEFLAEFANVHHNDVNTGRVFNSQALYVQMAYRLPWSEKRWKPYYRFEYTHVPRTEPVIGVTSLLGSTLGMRYDISDFAAFKGEYRNVKRGPGQPHVNGLFIQTSFTF